MFCVAKKPDLNQLKLIENDNISNNINKYQPAGLLRKEKGANDIISTPNWLCKWIRNYIYQNTLSSALKYSILDPCSGLDNRMLTNDVLKYYNCTNLEIRRSKDENFLTYSTSNKFDYIVMNPPFNNLGAWEFIKKALQHLKIDRISFILSIVPDYVLYNSEKRKKELNDIVSWIKPLPKDTFKDSGVIIHSSLIKVVKKSDADIFELCLSEE